MRDEVDRRKRRDLRERLEWRLENRDEIDPAVVGDDELVAVDLTYRELAELCGALDDSERLESANAKVSRLKERWRSLRDALRGKKHYGPVLQDFKLAGKADRQAQRRLDMAECYASLIWGPGIGRGGPRTKRAPGIVEPPEMDLPRLADRGFGERFAPGAVTKAIPLDEAALDAALRGRPHCKDRLGTDAVLAPVSELEALGWICRWFPTLKTVKSAANALRKEARPAWVAAGGERFSIPSDTTIDLAELDDAKRPTSWPPRPLAEPHGQSDAEVVKGS